MDNFFKRLVGLAAGIAGDKAGPDGTSAQGEVKIGTGAVNSGIGTSRAAEACPYCESKNFVKRGTRKNVHQVVQLYLCRNPDCGKTCITKAQLDQLLSQESQVTSQGSSVSSTNDSGLVTGDSQAPTITLNGNNPATVAIGAVYSDLGAIITDDVDQNIGYTVSLDNATSTDLSNLVLDTSVGGTHYIVFTAADQAGNVSHATRTVIIGDGSTTLTTGGAGDAGSQTSSGSLTSDTTATSTPIITPVVIDTATSTATSTTP